MKPTKEQVDFTELFLSYWQASLFESASAAIREAPAGSKGLIMTLLIVAAADIAGQNGVPLESIHEAVDMGVMKHRHKPASGASRIN